MTEKRFPIVGQRFKEALADAHLTQQELADKTGIGKSSISQYCNGTNCPARDRSEILGRILKVNPAWLMGFEAERDDEVAILFEQYKALPEQEKRLFRQLLSYAQKFNDLKGDEPHDGSGTKTDFW